MLISSCTKLHLMPRLQWPWMKNLQSVVFPGSWFFIFPVLCCICNCCGSWIESVSSVWVGGFSILESWSIERLFVKSSPWWIDEFSLLDNEVCVMVDAKISWSVWHWTLLQTCFVVGSELLWSRRFFKFSISNVWLFMTSICWIIKCWSSSSFFSSPDSKSLIIRSEFDGKFLFSRLCKNLHFFPYLHSPNSSYRQGFVRNDFLHLFFEID